MDRGRIRRPAHPVALRPGVAGRLAANLPGVEVLCMARPSPRLPEPAGVPAESNPADEQFEECPDGLVVADASFRIVRMNRRFRELVEYKGTREVGERSGLPARLSRE